MPIISRYQKPSCRQSNRDPAMSADGEENVPKAL